ncbi:MAG: amino acid adenylation domain-containing protein, partial [Thermoanaerobaculia bacterium]
MGQGSKKGSAEIPCLPRGDRPRFALSFAQQRLWFLEQLQPGSAAYNIAGGLELEGSLTVTALARSLTEVVRRHEALRTTFAIADGEPVQRIGEPAIVELPVADLSALAEDDKAEELRRQTRRQAHHPFDLVAGPLLRAQLLRLQPDRHLLQLTVHHIVADGWSLRVLLHELTSSYQAFVAGERPQLAELPVQVADVAAWQRRRLTGKLLESQLEYWRRQLADVPTLELPTDRRRAAGIRSAGERLPWVLSEELAEALQDLARRQGATLFVALEAAFAVLLSRFCGQDDVAVGTPVANRNRRQIEGLIGFFANTLVLRNDLSGNPTFRELLDRTRELVLAADAHQEVPFERLVDELRPERDLTSTPLFQVMFAFGAGELESLDIEGLTVTPQTVDTGAAKFDLTLMLDPAEEGLAGTWEYRRELFDPTTIRRLCGHFETLLEGIVVDPEARLSELPLASAAEHQQLIVEWNGRRTHDLPETALTALVEAQVDRSPDAVAVVLGRNDGAEERLSYRELDLRANRLARYLRDLGAGPEVLVGVLMERSLDMVVALLAVLKAGAAYLPLDRTYPRERLAWMLENAGAAMLVSQESLRADLPELDGRAVIVDGRNEAWEIARRPPRRLRPPARPDHLAYVIYTSGSTGRPKGVLIPHRNVVRLLTSTEPWFRFDESDVWTFFHSHAFDFSVWEIWGALATGGRLVVVPYWVSRSPEAFYELLRRHRVTVLNQTPSAFYQLIPAVRQTPAGEALSLREVIFGGEALELASLAPWYARFDGRRPRLVNMYGITETTVHVTYRPLASREVEDAGRSPIGRAIRDLAIHLLDRCGRPVPIGVVGEIHVGGAGLARGYLGRPALTAARFVPDPFSAEAGARLYRSGDLARYLPDGDLEFLGRHDHQVKLRGFRIELGEIEAALLDQAAVREAVVLMRDDGGDRRLVAHLVPATTAEPRVGGLRRALGRRLPDYMLPAAFDFLDALPLTANGKLDRAALGRRPLPAVEGSEAPVRSTPRPGIERTIAAVWRQVLTLPRVGNHDNFFDLGGHSLLLVRVHEALRQRLSAEFSLRDLFRYPTIASLAEHLSSKGSDRSAIEAGRERAAKRRERCRQDRREVAILAMAGRFPGASDLDRLWTNLSAGRESITVFSDEELRQAGVPPAELEHPDYVKAAGTLVDADLFDASFFGFAPREAELLDPQQRLFLECAWEALEEAGYGAAADRGAVGVFAGASFSTYLVRLTRRLEVPNSMAGLQALISNDKDFLATRVAYKLDLHGPAVTVQTACSTSLVAVHQACQSLLAGECDLAIAAGVSVRVPLKAGYLYQDGGILSRDGHCRAFAADAGGTVPGSGVGVVVLKPLADAVADGDPILAVIRGSAINNDGALKVGYTAPGVEGQTAVVSQAWRFADVDPATAGYVETHGTGTPLGDPIEIEAVTRVFGDGNSVGSCALGSIKTNIGHLDAAAGIAGLIKTVLALRHRQIPPSLHCQKPHPEIDFAAGRFYVNTALRDWPRQQTPCGPLPRRAGVSSFGVGGTNVHVVLEEAPEVACKPDSSQQARLLVLSARSEAALERAEVNLAEHLRRHPELDLTDIATTLQLGRQAFEHRRSLVCRDLAEAAAALATPAAGGRGRAPETGSPALVFLFPGQGTQTADMGADLYRQEPIFRQTVDRCAEILSDPLGIDVRELLYPPADKIDGANRRLRDTAVAQPLLFVTEVALARLWTERVGRPQAMIGHSLGEYVAAFVAGVFSFEDALTLVTERGRLMAGLPAGAMLAVPVAATELTPRLGPDLALAAVNAPDRSVASGPTAAIDELAERLAADGIRSQRLKTSHAFHSPMMEPILEPFGRCLRQVELRPPSIPYLSNLTGDWITPAEATDPDYWLRHLRQTVRFGDGVARLLEDPDALYVEVGPGRALGSLARRPAGSAAAPPGVGARPHRRRGGAAGRHRLCAVGP